MQLIRAFTQTLPDGRIHEMSMHRSDSFLYLLSLTANADRESGLWRGEMGLCARSSLDKLFISLRSLIHQNQRVEPLKFEAPIAHAASVERDGIHGVLRKEIETSYESATLYFSSRRKLEEYLVDLEGTLAWAA